MAVFQWLCDQKASTKPWDKADKFMFFNKEASASEPEWGVSD